MGQPYEVVEYSPSRLLEIFAKLSLATEADVGSKLHGIYFEHYFLELGAKSIIVEYDYVDRDYLEDFSNYYVKCFNDYCRKCVRLHFFSLKFSSDEFKSALSGNTNFEPVTFKNSYLGFIVIKPLPKTIIGRTCLKTYSTGTGRYFPSTRSYDVNLFGFELKVESLAYQEQDQVAAACATSALWSIFHKTGLLFHHSFPTPIEITKSATLNLPAERRNLPNNGLTLEQMAHAIRNVGLEPFPVKTQNEYTLNSTIYAYLSAGIPVAMAVYLFDTSVTPHKPISDGGHAIAITGYCMKDSPPPSHHGIGYLSKSSRIEKLYVHDDQVGPFARMAIDGVPVNPQAGSPFSLFSISSSWKGQDGVIGSVRAVPQAVLVPLYHKIRIPYDVVEKIVMTFDSYLEVFRLQGYVPLEERVEWDIHLSNVNQLRTEILSSSELQDGFREETLTTKLPRFLWRAIGWVKNKPALELVFDATDIEQGNFFIRGITYKSELFAILKSLSLQPSIRSNVDRSFAKWIFEWFRQ